MRIAIWLGGNKGHPYKQVAPMLKRIVTTIPGTKVAVLRREQLLAGNIVKFFDCIVSYTQGGEFLPGEEDLLLDFVASGKGFVGIHGATASFKSFPRYHAMLGGTFTGHALPRKFEARPTGKVHPITSGMQPFKLKDEPYVHDIDPSKVDVIVERVDKKETAPAAWTKEHGQGRVAYIAFGHFAGNFKGKEFQALISRAITWVARKG
ncbi:MAG: ThuA domain-containing protein [Candidatus Lokiarchaeota archaeon]|nr:ThuA domain-containing protein [Candidatus Lokiarchaeota archaeon]